MIGYWPLESLINSFFEISLDVSIPDYGVLISFRSELTQKAAFEQIFKSLNHVC
jgi:hypothetical protein